MKRYDNDVWFVSERLLQLEYYSRYLKASTDFGCTVSWKILIIKFFWLGYSLYQNQYFNCLDQPYAGMCILILVHLLWLFGQPIYCGFSIGYHFLCKIWKTLKSKWSTQIWLILQKPSIIHSAIIKCVVHHCLSFVDFLLVTALSALLWYTSYDQTFWCLLLSYNEDALYL